MISRLFLKKNNPLSVPLYCFDLICSMPIKMIDHGSHDYQKMVDLRMEILRRPLGLTFSKEDLEKEKHYILIGAFEED